MSGWPTVKVKTIARQIRGVTYDKAEASVEPRSGSTRLLRAMNITDRGLAFDDLIYVPQQRVSSNQMLAIGDVVIAASSGSLDVVGKAAQVRHSFDGTFGAFCKALRPNDQVDHRFFAHFFQTPSYRRRMSSLASGANINNLRNEHLDDLDFPLPSLSEQRRIAAILDQADGLRAKRRAALVHLDEMAQAILVDMFGDGPRALRRWKKVAIRDALLIPLRNGVSPASDGKIPGHVLTLSAVTGSCFREGAKKGCWFAETVPADKRVMMNDLLICRGNGNSNLVGRGFFPASSDSDVAFPDTMIAARFKDTMFSRTFIQAIWNSNDVRKQVQCHARTTNGTFKINQPALESIEVVCPPMPLQLEFSEKFRSLQKAVLLSVESLTGLDFLFASLQHRAFTGAL